MEKKKFKRQKFYNDLTMAQRKVLRAQLDKVVVLKKQQLDLFEKAFIKPLRKQILLAHEVRTNEVSLEHFLKESERWSKWLKTMMRTVEVENGQEPITSKRENK